MLWRAPGWVGDIIMNMRVCVQGWSTMVSPVHLLNRNAAFTKLSGLNIPATATLVPADLRVRVQRRMNEFAGASARKRQRGAKVVNRHVLGSLRCAFATSAEWVD